MFVIIHDWSLTNVSAGSYEVRLLKDYNAYVENTAPSYTPLLWQQVQLHPQAQAAPTCRAKPSIPNKSTWVHGRVAAQPRPEYTRGKNSEDGAFFFFFPGVQDVSGRRHVRASDWPAEPENGAGCGPKLSPPEGAGAGRGAAQLDCGVSLDCGMTMLPANYVCQIVRAELTLLFCVCVCVLRSVFLRLYYSMIVWDLF